MLYSRRPAETKTKPAATFPGKSRPALRKLSVLSAKLSAYTHASFARSLLPAEKQTYRRTSNSNVCVSCNEKCTQTIGAAGKECQGTEDVCGFAACHHLIRNSLSF